MKLKVLLNENKAKAAIDKNKAALTAAINKRLANDEDQRPYEAVEALLIKTAIDAGLPKEYAEDYPWMENYAVPEESTAAKDIKMLQGHLEDALNDPDTMSTTNTKKVDSKLDSKQILAAFEKAANLGVYLFGENAYNATFEDRMRGRNATAMILGWKYCHPVIVKDGSNVYLLFLDSPKVMFASKDPSGVVGIVQVKGSKFVQDVYADGQAVDGEAIKLKDRLAAKIAQAGFGDKRTRDELAKQTSLNPALNGKLKVPECSQIQSELVR